MRFLEHWAPLILCIREGTPDTDEVEQLSAGFEPHFQRATPYAVLNLSSLSAHPPSPRERQRLAEWANRERVRQASRALCAGSATVVARAWERHALVAMQWLWTPVSPHQAVATVGEGLEYCFSLLATRDRRFLAGAPALRQRIEQVLRAEGVAGLEASPAGKPAPPSLKLASDAVELGIRTLADPEGTIGVGMLAPGILWARVRGRLTMSLAATYTAHLARLLEQQSAVQFFIDSSAMASYELLARNLTTEFLLARSGCFSRLVLLQWSGGSSPMGRASADALGSKFTIMASQREFEAELKQASPSAAEKLATLDRSDSQRLPLPRQDR